jgi:RNA polymerase sigma-70 factor, ECF subfamily
MCHCYGENFYESGFLFYNRREIRSLNRMLDDRSHQITALLIDWSNGDEIALKQLMPLVYDELHQMARRHLRREASGHTLQTTELIHEAYLKLAAQEEQNWQNRAHFFGVAAKVMRHILVDHARTKHRSKRGGLAERITLHESVTTAANRSEEIVALDDALNQLATLDERKVQVVEMRFFGGLKTEEIAGVLKISPETVKRDWQFARKWLLRELANAA